ncbi:MAG: hypothetical protein C5B50_19270 [Verrucomicrobia bacterium]|nr:MAG: hypothetical protein C5B50_19270 [Verrucomicrobiota bacterium]
MDDRTKVRPLSLKDISGITLNALGGIAAGIYIAERGHLWLAALPIMAGCFVALCIVGNAAKS